MPAPNRFWLILIGKTATSFKATEREDLLPTYKQLQRTQPEVSLRWFERGKVWESPAAAEAAVKLAATEARARRPKEWRPGGDHRDPKARFQLTRDQKRAKFKRQLIEDSKDGPSPFGPRTPRDPQSDDRTDRPPRQARDPRPDRGDRGPRAERPGRPAFERNPFKRADSDRPRSGSSERPDRPDRPPRRTSSNLPTENPFKKDRPTGDGGNKPAKRRPK